MDIRLFKSRLEVSVNMGNFDVLTVSPARTKLNDGAWHHVRVHRSLSSILVEVDEGAGRGLSAFLPLNPTSNFLKFSIGTKVGPHYPPLRLSLSITTKPITRILHLTQIHGVGVVIEEYLNSSTNRLISQGEFLLNLGIRHNLFQASSITMGATAVACAQSRHTIQR